MESYKDNDENNNLFIYSQFHDNIYIQVYRCANGLDVGIAYICPLQFGETIQIHIYAHSNANTKATSSANTCIHI